MADDRLCGDCHRIHVTEGQIPAYCSRCEPPRLSPSGKRLLTYMMLGHAARPSKTKEHSGD